MAEISTSFSKSPLARRGRYGAGGLVALATLALAASSGCQMGYVLEQGAGQIGMLWDAVEIADLEGDESALDPERRRKLALIGRVKRYAEGSVGLDPGDAYTTYYDHGDRPITTVVSAAHPTALVPYQWSFPFAGRVPYKGYFDRADAIAEARRLLAAGWDVHVGGAAAFSTLGWFRDPVLSSMLDTPQPHLIELVIHELVHRTVYFAGRTDFNESLATMVARAATVRFLETQGDAGPQESASRIAAYALDLAAEAERARLFQRLRNDLDALYRSPAADEAKLRRKREIFATASRALARLAGRPEARIPATNAVVIAVRQYDEHVPLLRAALDSFDGDPARLMAFLKELPEGGDPLPALERAIRDRASHDRAIHNRADDDAAAAADSAGARA